MNRSICISAALLLILVFAGCALFDEKEELAMPTLHVFDCRSGEPKPVEPGFLSPHFAGMEFPEAAGSLKKIK